MLTSDVQNLLAEARRNERPERLHARDDRTDFGKKPLALGSDQDAKRSDDGDASLGRDGSGVGVVCEQRRVQAVCKRDGGSLTRIEQTEEPRVRCDLLDPEPCCCRDLPRAGEPGACDQDLVDDDLRNDDLGIQRPKELEMSRTTQVDERPASGTTITRNLREPAPRADRPPGSRSQVRHEHRGSA